MLNSDFELPLQQKPFHNEILFTTSLGRFNYKAYVSSRSRERYHASKSKEPQSVLEMQKLGECLPILEAKIHTGIRSKILDIKVPKIPTLKPFNRHKDWQDYCIINKEDNREYRRFEIAFANESIFMFKSKRYPITDFNVAGKRYRWVREYEQGSLHSRVSIQSDYLLDRYYSYLFELDAEQSSLTDNLVNNDVNPSNPLIAGKPFTFFRRPIVNLSGGEEFKSSTQVAKLVDNESVIPQKEQKNAVLLIDLDQELKGVQQIDKKLMIILVSITVILFEDDRTKNRNDFDRAMEKIGNL